MINLIPPSAEKLVHREYWIRVSSVWMILFGFAFLIISLLNLPVYVLVQSQLNSFLEEYKEATDETASFIESEVAVANANEIARLLAKQDSVEPFSHLIEELDLLTSNNVTILDFQIVRKENALDPIVITGVANSRLALSEFRDAIENNPLFLSAALPLSNLAKDKDIPFTITITPQKETTP